MCGIVGYIGNRNAQDLIYKGLSRLEYRGYDSSGIAALHESSKGKFETKIIKAPGKLKELKNYWAEFTFSSGLAIGHTRWATHGEANQINAHPHKDGPITIVHNGIIENHQEIRAELKREGKQFTSQTDSELFAHLVHRERNSGKSLLESVRLAFKKIQGASAFVILDERCPDRFVVVRNGSPLVIGVGKEENFVASDVPAILDSTKNIYYLEDMEVAEITRNGVHVYDLNGKEKSIDLVQIKWSLDEIDKQGYSHYMLKEIFEQPRAIADTLSAWIEPATLSIRLDSIAVSKKNSQEKKEVRHEDLIAAFSNASLVHIVACGTAAHAGFYGQQIIEKVAKIACRAELASEFRYRSPVLRVNDLGIVVSQSGETADTLAAVKLMKSAGMKVLAICNVRDSSIPRECDAVMYTNAGIEIGVASTKAFTTQMSLFAVLAVALGAHRKTLSKEKEKEWVGDLLKIPEWIRSILDQSKNIKGIADKYAKKKGFLFLGRGIYYPIALEGALKLKEIAYVHAEGYPSGELKHGPIAMVEPDMVVLAIAPESGLLHEKSVSNIEEVKARKGTLFSLISAMDRHLQEISDTYITLPTIHAEELGPLLAVIPLQLFSYYVAAVLGTEIDQPRNLAKSVTVE